MELSGVKAWYTGQDAFHVTSSRAVLASCVAQDAGRHGFYLAGAGAVITGGQADSCGRLEAGDGYHLIANGLSITGVRAADRGQTPGSPQRYGYNFMPGSSRLLIGTAGTNGVANVNGNPGTNPYVRISTDTGMVTHG